MSKNDAIDFSGSNVKLEKIYIHGSGDKGISVGEGSTLNGQDIIIENSNDKKILKPIKKEVIQICIDREKKDIVDVCTIIKECNIEEISKYLLKISKKKDFPDITKR